jgi:antitoxin VapB
LCFAVCVCYFASMISLSQETEALAAQLAAARRTSVEDAIRQALEAQVRALGTEPRPRRRMTVEQMAALGAEITALPLLDPRSPAEIMEDLSGL